jgi:DNA repair protein RecO (recombination protein O)
MTLEPAYVLHATPYRETSLIVQFFTLNYGKVWMIARSARGSRSRFKGCLIPFAPLLLSATGKTDLLQLTAVEMNGAACFLQGNMLFNGIYLNELIVKLLLQRFDPYPKVFALYKETLSQLQNVAHDQQQKILRIFEKEFLVELGYGLQLNKETTGVQIDPNQYYYYRDQGFMSCEKNIPNPCVFKGSHLLAIEKNNYEDIEILRAARRLMRLAIGSLLGNAQLKSRELFASQKWTFASSAK